MAPIPWVVTINTESQETKVFLEKNPAWVSAIFTKEVTIQPKRFPVLIHGVRTEDIQPEDLEKTVAVCTVLSYPSIGLGREVEGGLVLAGEECQGVRRGLVECGGGDN